MTTAVKKTISLPADLARDVEALARAEGKTLSAVIQDALRQARIEKRLQELRGIQGYWSRKARDKGILTERDLARYLAR
jgi:predicted transcriptional regulator